MVLSVEDTREFDWYCLSVEDGDGITRLVWEGRSDRQADIC